MKSVDNREWLCKRFLPCGSALIEIPPLRVGFDRDSSLRSTLQEIPSCVWLCKRFLPSVGMTALNMVMEGEWAAAPPTLTSLLLFNDDRHFDRREKSLTVFHRPHPSLPKRGAGVSLLIQREKPG